MYRQRVLSRSAVSGTGVLSPQFPRSDFSFSSRRARERTVSVAYASRAFKRSREKRKRRRGGGGGGSTGRSLRRSRWTATLEEFALGNLSRANAPTFIFEYIVALLAFPAAWASARRFSSVFLVFLVSFSISLS